MERATADTSPTPASVDGDCRIVWPRTVSSVADHHQTGTGPGPVPVGPVPVPVPVTGTGTGTDGPVAHRPVLSMAGCRPRMKKTHEKTLSSSTLVSCIASGMDAQGPKEGNTLIF